MHSVSLAEVLRKLMDRPPSYTPGLVSRLSGVPKATIVNWIEGRVARPRRWQDLVRVADALRLSEQDTDELLGAGGHSTVTELGRRVDPGQRLLLESWISWPLNAAPAAAALPMAMTPFLGRADERAAVASLICDVNVRVVTLTGVAGVGKTRLAIEVANTVGARFGDGVAFVALAPITDTALVPEFIAQTLGVTADDNGIRSELLASREQLVVLDNFEHVLAALPTIAKLLAEAPGLTLLVTSRAVLHLYGEHQFEVAPLSPPHVGDIPFDIISANPAMALFTQRAQAVNPSFQLSADNADVVAEICRRVDGLPLAIELAAARTAVLEPEGLLARLAARLSVLTWGSRDLPPRHQSLQRTLDWSLEQLDDHARHLFANLSVFMSGCRLDAAEAIGSPLDATEVLDALMALVDHSLVRNVATPRGNRFLMLETVRSYAASLLDEDRSRLVHEHALHYIVDLARTVERHAHGPTQTEMLDRADDELDNLRALLRWSVDHEESVATATIASSLLSFWLNRGPLFEGRRWLELALRTTTPLPDATLAATLSAAGRIAHRVGDITDAEAQLHQSLRLYEGLADDAGRARTLGYLGVIADDRGDLTTSTTLFNDCLDIARRQHDDAQIATALTGLGAIADQRHQPHLAVRLHTESAARFDASGDVIGQASALTRLAASQFQLGGSDALDTLSAAAVLWQRSGERSDVADCLDVFATVSAQHDQAAHAAHLAAAASRLRQSTGATPSRISASRHHALVATLRGAAGHDQFATAWQHGLAMNQDQALALALEPDLNNR